MKGKTRLLLTLLTAVLLAATAGGAATPEQQLQDGNRAYQDGHFEQAIQAYEAVLDRGYVSVALYHNLGNAWYRLGRSGKAALYYHRGLELSPGDSGLRENLDVIRSGFADPITPLPEFFVKRWWRYLHRLLGPNGWAMVGLVFLWAGFAGFWRWRVAAERGQRKKAFVAGMVLFVLSLLPLALSIGGTAAAEHQDKGVIVVGNPNMYNAADERSDLVRTLPAGAAVYVVDQIGEWVKVRLENGETGWLPQDSFEWV